MGWSGREANRYITSRSVMRNNNNLNPLFSDSIVIRLLGIFLADCQAMCYMMRSKDKVETRVKSIRLSIGTGLGDLVYLHLDLLNIRVSMSEGL